MNANNVLSKNEWKAKLKQLENDKQWHTAVEFMQEVIKNNPDDVDAYLAMSFLLMNILSYGDHGGANMAYYSTLVKDYFDESYTKFSDNPEYLFFTVKNKIKK